ncbi:MAG TPA: radical SAM/SPASM domain-containing protein [bacterium]|nr:radical SAM/SPASM domain-containing protein [bacterium]
MVKRIGAIKLPINRLHMELTSACNFSCEFCPDSGMKRERGMMSLDMAKSILDEVSSFGGINMVLFHVMGEPTLHPNMLEIAEYAFSRKIDVCLTTNGSSLNRDLVYDLQSAGVRHVIVSLQTPDEQTFAMRGAKGISFDEYTDRITSAIKAVINENMKIEFTLSFLSSPLRRLIIPIAKEFSIADTSKKLREYLRLWTERIMNGTQIENRKADVLKKIKRARSFSQNKINLTDTLSFQTRIVGDWGTHFDKKLVKAKFGFCPGLQENFGILWNGDYVFCCTDHEGKTSTANFRDKTIKEYLSSEAVQKTVRAMQKFRIINDYCQYCMGDTSHLNSLVKQIGSVLYFKTLSRNIHNHIF